MKALTMADYQRLDGINWSTLKELRRSPLHYQHALRTPRPDTPAMLLGRAVHTAVFEPDRLMVEYAVYTESKSKGEGARTRWAEFQAANKTRSILSAEDWATCCAIRDAVRSDPVASRHLGRGRAEQTIQWIDPDTKLRCKARLDWIGFATAANIVDLKTARDVGRHRFASQAATLAYHGQIAFYSRGWRNCCGLDPIFSHPPHPILIAVESVPPYDVVCYSPDDSWLEAGDVLVSELLSEVATRRASGCWPGAAKGEELTLPLPGWAIDHDWEVTEEE